MRVLPVVMSLMLSGQFLPAALGADSQPDVNFKIYSPSAPDKADSGGASGQETPVMDDSQPSGSDAGATPAADSAAPAADTASKAADTATKAADTATKAADTATKAADTAAPATGEATGDAGSSPTASPGDSAAGVDAAKAPGGAADGEKVANKILQGYIRVVPSGTKIPIIMDTAVDSDTSQEGDEFSARTGEDLTIDGQTVVPAGSVIKGRIAQLNGARRMDRSGSVALKFDTVTTPDNRQIPLVATLVARGGVVHARRGAKDIAIEMGIFTVPTVLGLGIGALAGGSSSASHIGGRAGAALIGGAIETAVGTVILLSKKGKKVDVRPGDELKIELGEDLRMPM